jgi:hypothetical protein
MLVLALVQHEQRFFKGIYDSLRLDMPLRNSRYKSSRCMAVHSAADADNFKVPPGFQAQHGAPIERAGPKRPNSLPSRATRTQLSRLTPRQLEHSRRYVDALSAQQPPGNAAIGG